MFVQALTRVAGLEVAVVKTFLLVIGAAASIMDIRYVPARHTLHRKFRCQLDGVRCGLRFSASLVASLTPRAETAVESQASQQMFSQQRRSRVGNFSGNSLPADQKSV
jgi:hypothetical protein